MKPKRKTPAGLRRAAKAAGSKVALAKMLGITPQSLTKWRRIPRKTNHPDRACTGVPREFLAPELYRTKS